MEKDIVREICKECNLKQRLVEELVKVYEFYNENLKDVKKDIKKYFDKKNKE